MQTVEYLTDKRTYATTILLNVCVCFMLVFFSINVTHADTIKLNRSVIDQSNVLTHQEEKQLHRTLKDWRNQGMVEAAILIVDTTGDESIFDFGMSVAETWQLGDKKFDDGLLILVATQDKKMHIFTGYGMEGILPDVLLKRIIRNEMTPHFKNRNYASGLHAGLMAIDQKLKTGSIDVEQQDKNYEDSKLYSLIKLSLAFIMFGAFIKIFFGQIMSAIFTSVGFMCVSWFLNYPTEYILKFACFVFIVTIVGIFNFIMFFSSNNSGGSGGGWHGSGGSFGGGGAGGSW